MQARVRLLELGFEDLARGGAIGGPRLLDRWARRGLGLARRNFFAEDLEGLPDVGKLRAREHRLFRERQLVFDAQLRRGGLAFRAALRLFLGLLGLLQRLEEQAHVSSRAGPGPAEPAARCVGDWAGGSNHPAAAGRDSCGSPPPRSDPGLRSREGKSPARSWPRGRHGWSAALR